MKIKQILIPVFLLLASRGIAQKVQLDSLLNLHNKHSTQDDQKLKIYNSLAEVYLWMQVDSGIIFSKLAIDLAQQLKDQKQLAIAYNNISFLLSQQGKKLESEDYAKKSLKVNIAINDKNGIAESYLTLSRFYSKNEVLEAYYKSLELFTQTKNNHGIGRINLFLGRVNRDTDLKLSIDYLEKALSIFQKEGNTSWISNCLITMGQTYYYFSELKKSILFIEKGLVIANQTRNLYNISSALGTLGNVYSNLCNYPKSIDYYFKAIKIAERVGNRSMMATVYGAMGSNFFYLKNYSDALIYAQKALVIAEELKSNELIAFDVTTIGNIYLEQGKFDLALKQGKKSLQINIDSKNDYRLMNSFESIGSIYIKLHDFENAFYYLNKALELNKKVQDPTAESFNNLSMARAIKKSPVAILNKQHFMYPDRNRNVIYYLNKSLEDGKKLGLLEIQRDAFLELSEVYLAQGSLSKSFNFYKQHIIYKDSIMFSDNENSIANLQIQYETEKKEQEITLLNKDKKIQSTEIQKQKVLRNGFIGGFGVVLLFAGVFFRQRNRIRIGNKELQKAKERAELSERYEQQFLANMSHEIRTPMNAVMGMTNLLINKNPRADQMAYLDGIKNSSDNLLYIINDILDLSKIESGKIELEQIDFSIRDVIDQVKQTLNHKAEEKGLELIMDVDKDVPEIIIGDPVRLNQVLINLTGNAIKFTDKGSVVLSCQSSVVSSDNIVSLKFSVVDTGIGIPKNKLQSVFESFSQAHSSDTRKYGGTGLGLSISKQFVELMGGKINIESEEKSGTTFSFVINLPIGSVDNILSQKSSAQIDGSILNGLRILLSDDNEYNRTVARDSLTSIAEVIIEEATNGKEVIDLLAKSDFDVVLMDVQMPVMDGYEATRYIREQLNSPKNTIPIIALTASVIKSDLDKCRQAGMNDYVPKPFIVSQLVAAIAKASGREIKYEEKKNSNLIVENINPHRVTDLSYLERFCEGDKVRMKKYIDLFLSSTPVIIEKIQIALDNNNLSELANQIHGFKTKLIMMGMNETKDLAMQIEKECKEGNLVDDFKTKTIILIRQVNTSYKELKNLT